MRKLTDILPVISPYQNGENVIGVSGIQIDERRLSTA
jgi:hypothetical protein